MKKLLVMLLLGGFLSVSSGYGRTLVDSLTQQHKQILLAEMGSLIKEYAFFHGGTMVWRYDCRADTTGNFRRYLAEQVAVLGDRTPPEWYYIDLTQPVRASELKLTMGRNDNFTLELAKSITKKAKKKERNRSLTVFFFADKNKRTTDFKQLYTRLSSIITKLTITGSKDSQALK